MKRMWSKNELKLLATLMATQALQSGNIDNVKVFENIVDAQGHKRFVEGDIVINKEGITQTYGKWSLSGSHLMIVLAGNIEVGTYSGNIAIIELPEWIVSKIVPVSGIYIALRNEQFFDGYNITPISIQFTKNPNKKLYVDFSSNVSISGDVKSFRIAYDLLIDNETPQSQN